MSRRKFVLVHREARRRAVEFILQEAQDGWVVTIAEPTRNTEQNAFLHAILTDVARQCGWAGRKWDVETWKRLMTAAWCRTRGEGVQMVPSIDGQGFDVIYQRTSTLSKRECSELCEYILAWGAEHGVQWSNEATA